jgi:hypothetical protein
MRAPSLKEPRIIASIIRPIDKLARLVEYIGWRTRRYGGQRWQLAYNDEVLALRMLYNLQLLRAGHIGQEA